MGDKCKPFRPEWQTQEDIPNLGSQIWFGFSFASFRIKVQMILYFNMLPIKNQFNRRGFKTIEEQSGESVVLSPLGRKLLPIILS